MPTDPRRIRSDASKLLFRERGFVSGSVSDLSLIGDFEASLDCGALFPRLLSF